MKANAWGKGIPVEIERLGRCTAFRRKINGEFYQWKFQYGFVEVVGDYTIDNDKALDNALCELKKKFKTILN